MAKFIEYIKNPWRIFWTLAARGWFDKMRDERYLKYMYRARLNEELELEKPVSLNDKLQWYKINYRTPLMTKCADKKMVRDYVKECGLGHLLNEEYGVYDSFDKIDFSILPESFYVKCNHGSGANVLINKKNLSEHKKVELAKYFKKQLSNNYYWINREWAYKNIEPKLICEKYLASSMDMPLIDINFFCFSGKVEMVYYNIGLADEEGKHSTGHRAILDKDFQYIHGARTQMGILKEEDISLPENIRELAKYAEILASPFPHARVDFFIVDDRAYFGEITFYSASGFMYLEPKELYDQLGNAFKLEIKDVNG